jgi:hypothetical protein
MVGAPYLYKYGVSRHSAEIIGRTDTGTWVVVRAVGGTPVLVKASLIDIEET